MAKKKPGTGTQDDEVEDEELDEVEDEELDETEDESETDDTADDEAGEDESDEEEEAEPTAEELKAQLAKVTRALKKANREAASRRIELDALKKKPAPKAADKANGKGKGGDDNADDELRTLREQNEKLLAEQRRTGARQAIAKAARRAKINWVNDTARDDAIELILRDAVINEDGTIDDVEDLLAEVVEDRPHLLAAKVGSDKKPRAGDTSATKRGSRKDLALDEDEIAQQFGIRDHRPTKK